MKQLSMGTGFEKYAGATRREQFLAEMDRIVPWAELCARMAPHYPKAGDGRPPKNLEMMLRIYCLQLWFNLSDPAVEGALYDSLSMRRFAGIDLGELSHSHSMYRERGKEQGRPSGIPLYLPRPLR
jgi:IS5 family transposase